MHAIPGIRGKAGREPGRGDMIMSFGGHLQTLREQAGLSRAELARRAGVLVSTLRNWENDRGFPGLPSFRRLAEALEVSVERLAEGVEDPEPNPEKPHGG